MQHLFLSCAHTLHPPTAAATSLKDALTEPKNAVAALIPALQTKFLEKLLADPSVSPTATRLLEAMYPDAVPALAADIRARFASALAPVKAHTANGKGSDFSDLTDYVGAAQPLLIDVARLARVPYPGASRAAYDVVLELVLATDPVEDCTIEAPQERVPFDQVADEMLVIVAERRKAEEGVGFVVGDELKGLKNAAAAFGWQFGMKAWFAKSIALLEGYAAEHGAAKP